MRDPLYAGNLRVRGFCLDVVAALAFGTLAVLIHADNGQPAAVAASVLIGAGLAVRRAAPTLMIVLALASATIQVVSDDIAAFAVIAYFPMFAAVGGHPDRRVRFSSLAVAIVGCLIAGWEFPHAFDTAPDPFTWFVASALGFAASAVVVIGGWAFGFIRYQRRTVQQARVAETIAELERRRLLDLYDEQTERTRLARDMHDVVAHSLAVVIAQAEGARYTMDSDPDAARDALGVIAGTARDALGDVRALLEQLRSEDTASVSRSDRAALFDRMRAAGMHIDVDEIGDDDTADTTTARVTQRVLTEALTNALKYGDLTQPVSVDLDWSQGSRLSVRNALSDNPLAPGGAGHGIAGMAERAALVGGRLRSGATDDGWHVELTIPDSTPQDSPTPKGLTR